MNLAKIIITLSLLVVSCKPVENSSVDIDSGKFITLQNKNTVPGVVRIDGCTATIVSKNTLVTAAHCISGPVCIRSGNYDGKCSSKVKMAPEYQENGMTYYAYDVAVAIFDNVEFDEYFNLASAAPQRQDTLQFIGYSEYKIDEADRGKGSKRWGLNKVVTSPDFSGHFSTSQFIRLCQKGVSQ